MSVVIRLRRMGSNKNPNYRVVAADSRCPRDGKFIEELGHYDPLTVPHKIVIKKDNFMKWLRNGARLSDTVRTLVQPLGYMKEFHEERMNVARERKAKKSAGAK